MSWAGKNKGKITNQFTAGGDKKAGIASSVGRNQFAYVAMMGAYGRAVNTIPSPADYKVSGANQLSGVGRHMSSFRNAANNGGVNQQILAYQIRRVRAGGPLWFSS